MWTSSRLGALFVKNKRILSTGYNGAPSGLEHCDVVGCAREGVASGTHHELCRAVHAEQNAIIQAALHGISIEEATLYCTHQPCILCAKMMINARVAKVVYQQSYPDGTALDFLQQAGIEVVRI
jgi:dCMP deaminase